MSAIRPRFALLSCLLAAAALTALPQEESAATTPPEGFELHGDAEAGRAVFLKKCVVCHGEQGDGQGRIKTDPPVRDLRDKAIMSRRSDWEILLVIRDGGPAIGLSPKMLPWGKLVSEQELHDLVAFVRSLSEGSPETEAESPP
jgi:mono/diheme cytochrome c family protein